MTDRVENETDRPPEPVVVGVDGSDTATRAVAWAAAEAQLRGRPLRILHAAPYARDRAGRQRARRILGRAFTVARWQEPAIPVTTDLAVRAPVDALAAAAERADLLVVGMIAGESALEVVLGSVAPGLVDRVVCPLVVVRGVPVPSHRDLPVVAGVSDPAADAAVLDAAFADAARHRSGLVVVHGRRGAVDEAERERLAAALAAWRASYPGTPVEYRVDRGSARDGLLRAARDARLLLLGARRHGTAAHVLLGSTSREVLRLAPIPVEIVQPAAPAAAPVPAGRRTHGALW